MRFKIFILGIVLMASVEGFADKGNDKDQALQDLAARAASARAEDQPALYTELAEHELKSADHLYTAGDVEDARTAVKEVETYSEKASEASTQTGKRLKDTEIAMRKMAAKLRDMKRTVSFEEQSPLQNAADHLESLRTNLLSHMFGKKQK